MIKTSTFNLLLSSVLLFLSLSTQAEIKNISAANTQIGLQFVTTNLNYTEKSIEHIKADTEQGFVPGFGTNLSVMKDLVFGNDYLAFQFSKLNGTTDYIGATNTQYTPPQGPGILSYTPASNYGAVHQTDSAEMLDFSGKIGKGFEVSNSILVTPYLEVGHHEWNRHLNNNLSNISAYRYNISSNEDYNNYYAGFGTMGQITPINNLVITANAMVGGTFSPIMTATGSPSVLSAIGPAPSTKNYVLGASVVYKVGLSFDYSIYKNFHANAGAEFSAFDYGKSDSTSTIPSSYEPASQSNYTTGKTVIGYSF